MVLRLLELVPELQALFVALLVDVTTAGRLAQASLACKVLLQQRLIVLREERRLAEQARMSAMRERKRTAVLELFEAVDGEALYRCKAPTFTSGAMVTTISTCGQLLCPAVVPHTTDSSQVLVSHLMCHHSAEFRALMLQLQQM